MAENIELQSFRLHNESDGVIEEYHEIKPDGKLLESLDTESFVSKFSPESINEYNFFTHDVKLEMKNRTKKKRRKKKEKSSNLMEIISSEIATLAVPITENLIEIVEDRQNYQSAYIQSFSREKRRLQLGTIVDSECG